MDIDFSLLENPEATKLNFDSSKHKRTLSKKGSIAHRRSPTRASTRPRSEGISLADSTGDEATSHPIDSNEVTTEEADSKVNPENNVQVILGTSQRKPGLVEGPRASQAPYPETRTIPKERITTSPAPDVRTAPFSSLTTTYVATLDASPVAAQNPPIPDLVWPKSVPATPQKSEIAGDEADIRASYLSASGTYRSEGTQLMEDSAARSQLPSSKVMLQSSSLKGVKSGIIRDSTTLPFAASIKIPHLEYSQGIPQLATSQSVAVQKRLRDPEPLPEAETRHLEVTKKTYRTKYTSDPKSTPRNPDSTKDNPNSTPHSPKSTPDSINKTPPAFKSTEYPRQTTNRERRSIAAVTTSPTLSPQIKYCTVDDTNTSSNSSTKTGSKYRSNQTFDVSEASGKNSAGLNSNMVAVDVSNRTDQNRLVYSVSQTTPSFGRISREIPEYVEEQTGQHVSRQLIDSKRTHSGNILSVTGYSESEKLNPKHVDDSSNSVEVYRHAPDVLPTMREVTIVCNLEHSLGGIKSTAVAWDQGTVGNLTESCVTVGRLQHTGGSTGVEITCPATDHTPGRRSGNSLTASPGRQLKEDDVKHQEERSHKVGVYKSSFCMQIRGGSKPGGNELGRTDVGTRKLPERTFTFSFAPKADSNTSLKVARETAAGQD